MASEKKQSANVDHLSKDAVKEMYINNRFDWKLDQLNKI